MNTTQLLQSSSKDVAHPLLITKLSNMQKKFIPVVVLVSSIDAKIINTQ